MASKLFAYLDDWYLWIKPQYLTDALVLISSATRSVNLDLQPSKIQVWRASCPDPIPQELLDRVISTHTYGSHSVPRHRHRLHLHATASCPTRATTNHTLATDEEACSPPRRDLSPQSKSSSTNNCLRAMPHHQSVEPSSSLSLHPTPVPIACNPTVKPTRLRTVVFVCLWPGDFCYRTLQPQTPQALLCHAPTKAQRGRSVANLWMLNSTAVMGDDTAVVSIASMPQWLDALQM